jgi:hypothetical protein
VQPITTATATPSATAGKDERRSGFSILV